MWLFIPVHCPYRDWIYAGHDLYLFFALYTALQMNNNVKNLSAMNPGHFRKKHDIANGKPNCDITMQHLAFSAKRTGAQR